MQGKCYMVEIPSKYEHTSLEDISYDDGMQVDSL